MEKRKIEYNEKSIVNLSFPDNIREKPTLYIGPIDESGVFTIVREVADNVVDEALAGRASKCDIFIQSQTNEDSGKKVMRGLYILDNGEGIPVKDMTVENPFDGKKLKIPAIKAILTMTHTSGKFHDKAYAAARGTHGLGVKASNALSRSYKVWTFRDGSWWHIAFEYGKTKTDLTKIKTAPKNPATGQPLKKGTLVYLEPDPKIFSVMSETPLMKIFAPSSPTMTTLLEWCRIASYFTPGLKLTVHHEAVKGGSKEFYSENGPKDFITRRIAQLNKQRQEENSDGGKLEAVVPISDDAEFVFQNTLFECILTFTNSDVGSIDAFTNGLRNTDGGVHLNAMMAALYSSLLPFAPKGKTFTQRELREGLVSLVNVRLSSPQFNSQTKEKLVDERAGKPVYEFLLDELTKFFKKHKDLATRVTERAANLHALKTKFLASKKVITALRAVAKKGLPVKGTVAPDCKPIDRELYIIEGDSAGGCFVGDTLIATDEGPVPIKDLWYSSMGPAWDVELGESVESHFSKSVVTKVTVDLVDVKLSDSTTVRCTPDHPFLATRGKWVEWVEAQHLTSGRFLESGLGNRIRVVSVQPITLDEPVPVFDITNLDGHQTFCLHNGVVVHNTAKQARMEAFQETLPIKGKVKNAVRDKGGKAVESEEIINILAQIGFDPKAEDPYSKLRVGGKIIMLADPDPDGPLIGSTSLSVKWNGEWHQVTMEQLADDPWVNRSYEVVTWNGHSTCLSEAYDCRITEHTDTLIEITLEDESTLTSSLKHRYPIRGSAILRGALPDNTGLLMVTADELKTGDRIVTLEDGGLKHEAQNTTGLPKLGCSFIRKIRKIKTPSMTPVYCLTVPVYHNFMLGNGVFSSNCHINSLLLSLIYKFLPELFSRGMIYVAETPEFYSVDKSGRPYFGKKAQDVEQQLQKVGSKAEVMHIKGYGEVSADILRLLAFDPATRNIVRIMPCETSEGETEFIKIMSGTSEARKAMLGI